MALKIRVRKTNDGVVLELSGTLTKAEAVSLGESIRTQLKEGVRSVVLDFAHVSGVDSAGLGELVSAYTSIRNQGGSIRIVGLQSRSRDLLQRTNLSVILEASRDYRPGHKTMLRIVAIVASVLLVAALLYFGLRG